MVVSRSAANVEEGLEEDSSAQNVSADCNFDAVQHLAESQNEVWHQHLPPAEDEPAAATAHKWRLSAAENGPAMQAVGTASK